MEKVTYTAQQIIDKLIEHKGAYFDDRQPWRGDTHKAQLAGIFVNDDGQKFAFIGTNRGTFSINSCYINDDDQVVLSTMSVGGNVRPSVTGFCLDAFREYNLASTHGQHVQRYWKFFEGNARFISELADFPLGTVKPYFPNIHHHDADGRLFNFVPRTESTPQSGWFQVRDGNFPSPEQVFVRDEGIKGKPYRYIRLDLFEQVQFQRSCSAYMQQQRASILEVIEYYRSQRSNSSPGD